MSNDEIKELLDQRKRLVEELTQHAGVLHGTFVERYTVCSRPNCACHRGEKHGPRYHLAVMEDGKQRQHYIRLSKKDQALQGLEHNRIIEDILQKITRINLELMKEDAYGRDGC